MMQVWLLMQGATCLYFIGADFIIYTAALKTETGLKAHLKVRG
jgi:hypothetical protein